MTSHVVALLDEQSLPVLVFDGDCGFCTTSAHAARRWLHLDHVEPWQHLDLDPLGLRRADCEQAVQWVDSGGAVAAERAIIAALRHAGGSWRFVGGFLALPIVRPFAGLGYRFVARNRHRMPGGTPACSLPAPSRKM